MRHSTKEREHLCKTMHTHTHTHFTGCQLTIARTTGSSGSHEPTRFKTYTPTNTRHAHNSLVSMTTTTLPPKRLKVFQDAYKLGLSTIKPLATLSRAKRQDAQVS